MFPLCNREIYRLGLAVLGVYGDLNDIEIDPFRLLVY